MLCACWNSEISVKTFFVAPSFDCLSQVSRAVAIISHVCTQPTLFLVIVFFSYLFFLFFFLAVSKIALESPIYGA